MDDEVLTLGVAQDETARDLSAWGWDEGWQRTFNELPGATDLVPARVIAQHRGRWIVASPEGELPAEPSGRLRHRATDGELPATGDWVAGDWSHARSAGSAAAGATGVGRIEAVLPRRSLFRRKAAGPRLAAQVIAANVETLLVATSLNRDLNPRRLERYVAMALEAGVDPLVVLTKADLSADADAIARRVAAELHVTAVAVTSSRPDGLDPLRPFLGTGRTVALVGSSGVGKSTLLNRLAGETLMETKEIREDDSRGRHTTTHRELFRLAGGTLLLDTPGMRELGLWDAEQGLSETFDEIAELAASCRFADCRHEREPGCAVRAAVDAGNLDERRLRSHRRLARELADVPPAARREEARRFAKAVRDVSADTMRRKSYRERDV